MAKPSWCCVFAYQHLDCLSLVSDVIFHTSGSFLRTRVQMKAEFVNEFRKRSEPLATQEYQPLQLDRGKLVNGCNYIS